MANFYEAAFHCTRYEARILDRPLPGRELAEELAAELMKLGLTPLGVFDEEPFWTVRLPHSTGTVDIMLFLHSPETDLMKAVWCVSLSSKMGLLDRLRRKPEDPSTVALLNALHQALRSLPHVQDIRWFKELPSDPYNSNNWATEPTV